MNTKNVILIAIAALLFGGVIGYFAAPNKTENNVIQEVKIESADDLSEMRAGGYKYINPLLECDNYNHSKKTKIALLENKVKPYIQQVLQNQRAMQVSIYFRDLNNGPWMGVGENDNYSPASLLKVPVLIAVLKKAEKEQGLLNKKLRYDHPVNKFTQNIDDEQMIQVGNSYTVEDLLRRMIAHSDNEAKDLLYELIGDEYVQKTVNELGFYIPSGVTEDFMSLKQYSSFFRLLYNATYLNKEMSEKALSILSNTNFKDGIVAGVPKGVIVSHKFGERGYHDSYVRQLHDCGIVYPKDRAPYLLCIATRGVDFKEQGKIIAEISSIVYKMIEEGQ